MYNKFLIIPNPLKQKSMDFVSVLSEYIVKKNKIVYVPEDCEGDFGECVKRISHEELSSIDMAIILGGDGTFLRNIAYIKHSEIPVFGINFGHLGYLTQCDPEGAFECIDRILCGDFKIEDRIMIKCIVEKDGKQSSYTAVNEIVLHRDVCDRALHINVCINGNLIENFYADGILVSTPTGSTAYNMSAGGPVVVPTANNFVITPICAPKADCSIVTSGDDEIMLTLSCREGDTYCAGGGISIDNVDFVKLNSDCSVTIKKSRYSLRTVRFDNDSFYQTLKYKLYKSV